MLLVVAGAEAMGEGNATKVAVPAASAVRTPQDRQTASQPVVIASGRTVVLAGRRGGAKRWFAGALSSGLAAWKRERDHGSVFLFVPVFIGTGAWSWYALARDPPLVPLLIVLLGFGLIAVFLRHRQTLLSFVTRAAFLLLLGMALSAIESWRLSTVMLDQPVTTTITGRVLSREADDRGRLRYRVALLSTDGPTLRRPPNHVSLLARSPHPPLPIGSGIVGRARLNPPSGPALPGLNDFAFDAYFAGTGAIGYFYGKPAATELNLPARIETAYGAASRMVAEWRSAITQHIRGRIGGDAGAISAALITAEQRGISPKTVEALRQSGLAHVLAISGLNMALAAGTFLVGARLLLALVPGAAEQFPIKKIAAIGGLITVTLYILISGGAVSAIRSWLMIVVMLFAVLFDRTAISLRNVALSALIILAVTPSAVTGPGFQMSYAATLGLVAGYAAWRDWSVRRSRWIGDRSRILSVASAFAGGILLSSLIGGVATLVYSIGHFHRIPAYGLAGNLLAMPIISFIVMPMAVIAMLLMPLGLDGIPLAIMGRGVDWIIAMANWVAGWGGEVVTGRLPPAGIRAHCCRWRVHLPASHPSRAHRPSTTRLRCGHCGRPSIGCAARASRIGGRPAGGARHAGEAATNRSKPPDFIYDQWRRALRIESHRSPLYLTDEDAAQRAPAVGGAAGIDRAQDSADRAAPVASLDARQRRSAERELDPAAMARARDDMRTAFATAANEKRFVCRRRAWCAGAAPAGWRVLAVEDPAFLGTACDSADLVVVPRDLRMETCRSGAQLVSARSLRRTGALEITPQTFDPTGRASYSVRNAVTTLHRPWSRHRLYDWRTNTYLDLEDAVSDNGG
ncbi:ComEC/Rec2-related protein [Mycoplana sp. BE70]|uniref:ComEC/Rec2 family competence protein n=1 Tax=Mycoplana sp. BE70 TaxID=2817775 RepID=UPI0028600AD6|nr:ComEC/Rec2 family competence protein [Mycoplana sp. BE70]MDR6758294.1 ComEC/Rec2-related protein [Mycoplana sp. BE70]